MCTFFRGPTMIGFHILFDAFAVVLLFVMTLGKTEEDDLKKLALANNEYTFNLYKQITNGSSENVFFSPLSLSSAMGMLYLGAEGETADELRKVLGYETADLEEQQVHSAFHRYLTQRLQNNVPQSYVLNSANSILVDSKFHILPDYIKRTRELYDTTVQVFDFQSEEKRVIEEVNEFAKNKTNGKIGELLDELPSDAALLILNAVYFKGTWATLFDPNETRENIFYNKGLESNAKEVQMMSLYAELPNAEITDCMALELPYKGDNISMLILLPKERNGLSTLESNLTSDVLANIRRTLRAKAVNLFLPKFKLQFWREISGDMKTLGAKKMFSSDANFSGITDSPKILVQQILHKAVVEVNEEGSEAAAFTYAMMAKSFPLQFIANHPFIFFIIDKRNDMILFSGRVITL